MKFCKDHWQKARDAVDRAGMSGLVPQDGAMAAERMRDQLEGAKLEDTFDPLMEINNHFMIAAMNSGGLYIMGKNETGENDGHYCPVCEFVKHAKGFDADVEIAKIVGQMATWAREKKLTPPLA